MVLNSLDNSVLSSDLMVSTKNLNFLHNYSLVFEGNCIRDQLILIVLIVFLLFTKFKLIKMTYFSSIRLDIENIQSN